MNPSESTSTASPSVILVGVDFGVPHFDGELEELGLLAQTAGYTVADRVSCKRRAPDPALFVGSGKADEIKLLAQSTGASEVLFDQALSPAQQRNLERHLGLPVNDRTLLILEIFAQRARSHEGKLQVELARLQYLSTRLVRRWSHLERQSGGIGMRGGPGEKQIELDRRLISDAIKRTKERLGKVKKQRATQRRQRERRDAFNISLVGYTNAGKSSLFNGLVKARTYAADQLFATLDTTTRQLYLGEAGRSVSLSDTVGFIRDLPHGLVDAFAATLQEAVDADLLLHVVDASNPAHPEQIASVMGVLKDIGADQIPQILVFNKLDAMDPATVPALPVDLMELDGQSVPRIYVSARSGQGFPELRGMLAERVMSQVGEAGDMGPYDQGSFEGIENT
ncbi:MAG: GTPase HflX [Hydrogenophaga sp.]|uniref:GTPase HflX n=1 Tax=Hydrogenophaga sp. TaxID=1904254 RepID=UPI00271C60FA|nr:GTPase HflX [Hydrogenophaga sp.]MDO9479610.1 GTPase HflX [Hydrogenophaga sp.]MDP2218608.1 GTPase HflX [Hydrogenophaga sp.]MDP3343032.1 GTPase HflX [Hydrogenophaga sp.]MDP3807861.1 GTPase HflX [Hydrogenophaga sp.]MDP3923489.1 GTPase HflX [Hydrogenophaga sp.]